MELIYVFLQVIVISFVFLLYINKFITPKIIKQLNITVEDKFIEIKKLKDQVKFLTDQKKSYLEITPRSRGLYKIPLQWSKTKESFEVLYEVEVIDVSTKKIKIKAIDYYTEDKKANDTSSRNDILSHCDNVWIEKGKFDLIIERKNLREMKISDIIK